MAITCEMGLYYHYYHCFYYYHHYYHHQKNFPNSTKRSFLVLLAMRQLTVGTRPGAAAATAPGVSPLE